MRGKNVQHRDSNCISRSKISLLTRKLRKNKGQIQVSATLSMMKIVVKIIVWDGSLAPETGGNRKRFRAEECQVELHLDSFPLHSLFSFTQRRPKLRHTTGQINDCCCLGNLVYFGLARTTVCRLTCKYRFLTLSSLQISEPGITTNVMYQNVFKSVFLLHVRPTLTDTTRGAFDLLRIDTAFLCSGSAKSCLKQKRHPHRLMN